MLVFGPDLDQNLTQLIPHLQQVADKLKTKSNVVESGTTFHNLSTKNVSRNSSLSASHAAVSCMKFLINSFHTEIIDEMIDPDFVVVVAKSDQMMALAACLAKAFPDNFYSQENAKVRELKIHFFAVDEDTKNPSDKSHLLRLMKNIRYSNWLVDTPPNIKRPKWLYEQCQWVVEDLKQQGFNVLFTGFNGKDLLDHGMNAIYMVGSGYRKPVEGAGLEQSYLAVMKLDKSDEGLKKTVALVGKGVTYDTGGYSIKGKWAMNGMKQDMGGAGSTIAAFKNLVESNFNQNLYCIIPIVENNVGMECFKVDDIITMHSKKTVEVINTDAEGRLILADAVSYASNQLNCDIIFDMATLTGASGTACGIYHAAVYTNDLEVERKVQAIGRTSGDMAFPIVYAPDLNNIALHSEIADMMNTVMVNGMNANSAVAGCFIGNHLKNGHNFEGIWCHIDFATLVNPYYPNYTRWHGWGVSFFAKYFKQYLDLEERDVKLFE